MTQTHPSEMEDIQPSTPTTRSTRSSNTPIAPFRPDPHHVDPDGDLILFVSKTNEFDSDAYFRVSSKHFNFASTYFKRLNNPEILALQQENDEGSIQIENCKPDTLLIILNIIPGRVRQVPQSLSLK